MNNNINIKTGQYDVYSSGSIMGIGSEPVIFYIENLTFKLIFEDDLIKTNKERIEASITPENIMEIKLSNFNSPLGSFSIEPLIVGNIDNRKLLFNFKIFNASKGNRLIHYCWYLGEENSSNE